MKEKKKIKMLRTCGRCHTKFDWSEQITEWIKYYGNDWREFAMMMIICSKCHNYCGEVDFLEGDVSTELVESPALKGEKIRVPTSKPSLKN